MYNLFIKVSRDANDFAPGQIKYIPMLYDVMKQITMHIAYIVHEIKLVGMIGRFIAIWWEIKKVVVKTNP